MFYLCSGEIKNKVNKLSAKSIRVYSNSYV